MVANLPTPKSRAELIWTLLLSLLPWVVPMNPWLSICIWMLIAGLSGHLVYTSQWMKDRCPEAVKMLFCFGIAAFISWQVLGVIKPLTPINEQIATAPKFRVTIENIYTHMLPLIEMKTLGTNIILVVSIENSGAESFAKWQPLTVVTSDGRSFTGILKATSDDTKSTARIGDNIYLTWWGVDALYNKTVRNPITRGRREIGILEYVVVEQEGVLVREGTKLHLTALDFIGKEHSTDYVWQTPQSKALVCFPGLKMQYEDESAKFIRACN